jgi:hypothetical protein
MSGAYFYGFIPGLEGERAQVSPDRYPCSIDDQIIGFSVDFKRFVGNFMALITFFVMNLDAGYCTILIQCSENVIML